MTLLSNFISHRRLLLRSIKVEIHAHHAGTILGLSWIVVGPFLLLALYSLIYAVIFKVKMPGLSQSEYILNVFSGLVLFLAFAQAMGATTSALSRDRKLLFSNYPPEFIPAKAAIAAYLIVLPGSAFVIAGDVLLSTPSWHLLLLPVVALLQLCFSVGLGCLLSLLGIVMRDITFLIQYIVIALMIVTPIAYTPDSVPARVKPLLYLNPIYYHVSANQHLILLNELPPMIEIVLGTSISITMLLVGIWVFRRARVAMMDLL
ncbi:MAG: ABC-2 type transporter [Candidatus Accumulibacter regalis]|jgi:ABC-type polysaccharide/polyol phosphate export systems, permease component|uniref:Transport permease protein n=1 Tax=Accumulibacter regalis TaxID=522306 RepID=A0A011R8C1_ACCRE|nr:MULTISPECIES: ABC transporter permease [unclassified Candidatus Accumulibacter]EXI87389.1 MAG: ABC-2 type transporter [Candidatus Accumulibacter regalis]MBL8368313.1 ABC transporter permease [Accumulibacter sp.]HRE72424.1 ABC transporter permease [Accumulibacter sp.]